MENLYEAMIIVDPAQSDAELDGTIEQIKSLITRADGQVESAYPLFRRRLAYQIGPHTEGTYVLVYFRGAAAVDELKRELQMSSAVLRILIVCANEEALWLEGPPKPPAEAEREEAAAAAKAPAAEAEVAPEPTAEAEAAPEPTVEAEAAPEEPAEAEATEPAASETVAEAPADAEPPAESAPAEPAAETPPAAAAPAEEQPTEEPPTDAESA